MALKAPRQFDRSILTSAGIITVSFPFRIVFVVEILVLVTIMYAVDAIITIKRCFDVTFFAITLLERRTISSGNRDHFLLTASESKRK